MVDSKDTSSEAYDIDDPFYCGQATTEGQIDKLAKDVAEKREEVDELEEALSDGKKALGHAEWQFIQFLEDNKLKSVDSQHGKFKVDEKTYYSIPKGDDDVKESAFTELKKMDLEGIIKTVESVHYQTLNASLRDKAEGGVKIPVIFGGFEKKTLSFKKPKKKF